MSTTDRENQVAMPWLVDGEQLDRTTFHERYAAMPKETRAESIGGVVSMASPLGMGHGKSDHRFQFWLGYYRSWTPGTEGLANGSVFLEDHREPQPDGILRILPECAGRTQEEGDYYSHGPELVVEVSHSSLAQDLGPELADYERAGVPEYIVLGVDPPRVRWHSQADGRLIEVEPGEDGIYRSKIFPGLWLDPAALLAGDLRRLREVVDLGVATEDHARLVRDLAEVGGDGRV